VMDIYRWETVITRHKSKTCMTEIYSEKGTYYMTRKRNSRYKY